MKLSGDEILNAKACYIECYKTPENNDVGIGTTIHNDSTGSYSLILVLDPAHSPFGLGLSPVSCSLVMLCQLVSPRISFVCLFMFRFQRPKTLESVHTPILSDLVYEAPNISRQDMTLIGSVPETIVTARYDFQRRSAHMLQHLYRTTAYHGRLPKFYQGSEPPARL